MTKKEREDRKAWLASLKAGDEVGVANTRGPSMLVPVTDADRRHVRATECRSRLRWDSDWFQFTDDTILAVVKLMDEDLAKREGKAP